MNWNLSYFTLNRVLLSCRLFIPSVFFFFFLVPIFSQEVCDNQIDDDGNGLIDGFDPACLSPDPICGVPIQPRLPSDFVPVQTCQLLENVIPYAAPMVGDVDADGDPEIVTLSSDNGGGVVVIDGANCVEEAFIPLNGVLEPRAGNLVLGDVDEDGFVDIFATSTSTDLQRIEFNGNGFEIRWTAIGVVTAARPHLDIVDLNQDGQAEIIPNVGRMVNGVTGVTYQGEVPELDDAGKGLFAFTADADLGNNGSEGEVELIRGSEIYRYDFALQQWNLIRTLPGFYQDDEWTKLANVALGDMDLDGDVDAIVSSFEEGQLIVWDLQQAEVFLNGNQEILQGGSASRATIGNFDLDRFPEIAICSNQFLTVYDDLVNANGQWRMIWTTGTNDDSGHTQTTAFDFDGDGKLELAYRDTDKLRVFQGEGDGNGGPLVLFDTGDLSCISATGMEYPTIADINNDGQANIIVPCTGFLSVYSSGSFPWFPARSIWNTQAYHITNVNENGTIPAVFQENHLVYNNYLNQSASLIIDSSNVAPAPDLTIQLAPDQGNNGLILDNCPNQGVAIVEICNVGSAPTTVPIHITVYEFNPYVNIPFPVEIMTDSLIAGLDVNECLIDTISFPLVEGDLTFLVNHRPNNLPLPIPPDTVYSAELECDFGNNAFILPPFSCGEICDNGIDDDGDGWIDNEDPDCTVAIGSCQQPSGTNGLFAGDFGNIRQGGEIPNANQSIWIFELLPGITDYNFGLDQFTFPTIGNYVLANNTEGMVFSFYGSPTSGLTEAFWISTEDNSADVDGYMMVVNGDTAASIVYAQEVEELCADLTYELSFDIINLFSPLIVPNGTDNPLNEIPVLPNVEVVIAPGTATNQELRELSAAFETGEIINDGQWNTFNITFSGPPEPGNVFIVFRSKIPALNGGVQRPSLGNDFAIDNLSLTACIPEVSISFDPSLVFPLCGEDTIEVTGNVSGNSDSLVFQWQLLPADGQGSEWINIPGANQSNLVLTEYNNEDEIRLLVANDSSQFDRELCRQTSNILFIEAVPALELTISGDTVACAGDTINLSATTDRPAAFLWSPNTNISSIADAEVTILAAESVTYRLEAMDEEGCVTTDSIAIQIASTPIINLGSDTTLCQGDSIQLEVMGGSNYNWSPSIGLSDRNVPNPIAFPDSSTTYIVSIDNQSNCSDSASITLNVLPTPELSLGTDTTICEGDSIRLSVQGADNILWRPAVFLSDPNSANPIIFPDQSTTFFVEASNGTCLEEDTINVNVVPAPQTSLSSDRNPSICRGDSIQLIADGGNNYSWTPEVGLSNSSISSPLVSPNQSTLYTVSISNVEGCERLEQIEVIIENDTSITLANDTIVCEGNTLMLIGGDPSMRYRWSTNQIAPSIEVNPSSDTIFWLLPPPGASCAEDTSFIAVNVVPPPTANFSVDSSSGSAPFVVQFFNESNFATAFKWEFGDGSVSNAIDPIHIYEKGGMYEVSLIALGQEGCRDSITFSAIEVINSTIYLPNAFSPNGDGLNDQYTFEIQGFRQVHIQIFDRWGRLMVESFDLDFSWDGTLNGQSVQEGVYVITIEGLLGDNQIIKRTGTITLLK